MGDGETGVREDEDRGPVLEHCGIDIDRFEALVDQNNYGESTYPAEDEE